MDKKAVKIVFLNKNLEKTSSKINISDIFCQKNKKNRLKRSEKLFPPKWGTVGLKAHDDILCSVSQRLYYYFFTNLFFSQI